VQLLMNILMWVDDWNGKIPMPAVIMPVPNRPGERVPLWTGKQIFSLVVPPGINLNHTRSNGHVDRWVAVACPLAGWLAGCVLTRNGAHAARRWPTSRPRTRGC
jgi:hypothetical protein